MVGGERVLESIQCLDDPHCRSSSPVKAARCRELELDHQLVELDGATPSVSVDGDASGYGIHQAEVIGCRHAVHQHAQLIASGNGIHDDSVVWRSRPLRQSVDGWVVIQAPVHATQVARLHHALQGFIDGIAGAELREISRRPDVASASGDNQR